MNKVCLLFGIAFFLYAAYLSFMDQPIEVFGWFVTWAILMGIFAKLIEMDRSE